MRTRLVMLMIAAIAVTAANADQKNVLVKVNSVKDAGLQLTLTPGPAGKELSIAFSEATADASLTITDLKGTRLLNKTVGAGSSKANLNIAALSSGTYFLVFSNGGARTSKVFVKQ